MSVFSFTDGDGGHGAYCHHSELLPDWSVRSAAASLPVAQPRDGHHLYRHPRGTSAAPADLSAIRAAGRLFLTTAAFCDCAQNVWPSENVPGTVFRAANNLTVLINAYMAEHISLFCCCGMFTSHRNMSRQFSSLTLYRSLRYTLPCFTSLVINLDAQLCSPCLPKFGKR